jgi:hypothetical protein
MAADAWVGVVGDCGRGEVAKSIYEAEDMEEGDGDAGVAVCSRRRLRFFLRLVASIQFFLKDASIQSNVRRIFGPGQLESL